MLTDEEFEAWAASLALPAKTVELIRGIRGSEPVRSVRSGRGNVSGRYASSKMGKTIQFESHRIELATIVEMDADDNVLEFYDQPSHIKITYLHASGSKNVGVVYTPDFFVLRKDSAGWEEWKAEDDLANLAKSMPNRYKRGDAGWFCPPASEYAAQYGLYFRVRSSLDINPMRHRNLKFLQTYMSTSDAAVDDKTRERVLEVVHAHPGISLEALRARARATVDDTSYLIAHNEVYVDLAAAPLSEPQKVSVFRDNLAARLFRTIQPASPLANAYYPVDLAPGAKVEWDGQLLTVVNLGAKEIALASAERKVICIDRGAFEGLVSEGVVTGANSRSAEAANEAMAMLTAASPKEQEEALRRYYAMTADPPTLPERTLDRYRHDYRAAEEAFGIGFIGLIPHITLRGNRVRKIDDAVVQLMEDVINDFVLTKKAPGFARAYGELKKRCEEAGWIAPCRKTFANAINRRPTHELQSKRQGHRAAYESEPRTPLESRWDIPVHGERPIEIGHIDHTQLDVELVCSQTGQSLGRPWATFLTDATTRRLLAVYLTFDPPSYRSAMMVLRLCVQRHSRLPETIVVDGGAEFRSTYFETFVAAYGCTKKQRPPGKPRFGSTIERLFNTSNTEFVHNLIGNTKIMKNPRQATKSVNPKNLAVWTLPDLYGRLCEWAYEVYDTAPHTGLGGISPRDAYLQGMEKFGLRPQRIIPQDGTFYVMTLPSTPSGHATVQPGQGIKVNYMYYWNSEFREPAVEKSRVPIRYDPMDMSVAYAFVKNHWVKCIVDHPAAWTGVTEKELALITQEWRQRNRNMPRKVAATSNRLAELHREIAQDEAILLQRAKDHELQRTLAALSGSAIHPEQTRVEPELPSKSEIQASPAPPRKPRTMEEF